MLYKSFLLCMSLCAALLLAACSNTALPEPVSDDGLSTQATRLIALHQAKAGIDGYPEAGDWFGRAVATGDFNGDGYDDTAVGAPYEALGSVKGAGMVHTVYGASGGLTALGSQVWHQDSPGIGGAAETDDSFGATLAAGDFNGDNYDDLAISAPGETLNGAKSAGMVHVLFGSPSGLTATNSQLFNQATTGIEGAIEAFDRFGDSLAAGDLNNDGHDDLAIGTPQEAIGQENRAGMVTVLFGWKSGLTTHDSIALHQDKSNVPGQARANYGFGTSLAIGKFERTNKNSLAISAPREQSGFGKVFVVDFNFYQYVQNVNTVESPSHFSTGIGANLTAADFNGDGYDDLAMTAVRFSYDSSKRDSGAVYVINGKNGALDSSTATLWTQDTPGITGSVQAYENFGGARTPDFGAIIGGDFNGDGYDDLAVGNGIETIYSSGGAGAVNVIFGSATGLNAAGNLLLSQVNSQIEGWSETGDYFGATLASGDFDKDGKDDLIIGAPGETIGTTGAAGMANIHYFD